MTSEPIPRSESFTVFIPELEHLVTEAMEEWKVPGLAVAVVQNGEVAFVRPHGFRDVEAGLKVTTDTQFQLMSVWKPFTATGLALLVDEQRTDWKKPVREYMGILAACRHRERPRHRARFALPPFRVCASRLDLAARAICYPDKCWGDALCRAERRHSQHLPTLEPWVPCRKYTDRACQRSELG
jgi:beta-lactamase family protein